MKKVFLIIILLIITSLTVLPVQAFYLQEEDAEIVRQGVLRVSGAEANWLLLIRQYGIYLTIFVVALVIFSLVGILNTYRHLSDKKTKKKIRLFLKLLVSQPAKVFALNAPRDKRGTYNLSFIKHKALHDFSKRSLYRLVGLVLIIMVIMSVITVKLNHDTKAKEGFKLKEIREFTNTYK